MEIVSRKDHLAWCKRRAVKYIDAGDLPQALTSMGSDLNKHPETENHSAMTLGVLMLLGGQLGTPDEMRKFIEGFN